MSDGKAPQVNPRNCTWCGRYAESYCDHCVAEFAQRPDPKTMKPHLRIAEVRWFLDGPGQHVEVPFDDIHGRIDALMGRQIWTHEMANPACLIAEAECRFLGENCDWSGPNGDEMIVVVVGRRRQ